MFAQEAQKNVLVLSSYHQGLSWTDSIVEGITSVFRQEDRHIELWFEYMDTKRVSHDNSFRILYKFYEARFQAQHFDVILAADNDAFNFLRLSRDRLFPGTPVVFCGVNSFHDSLLRDHSRFTGIAEAPDFLGTVKLALKLHPNMQHMIIINDRTSTGNANQKILNPVISLYKEQLEITVFRDFVMNDLLDTLSQSPPNTLIFAAEINQDATGRYFSYERSMELLSNHTQAPVYGFWDFYLNHGVVGGSMISGFNQGKAAAEIAVRILNGENADDIPVLQHGAHQYMFDDEQLKRFGLPLSKLPPQSRIVNKPISFYEQHRFWIFGVSGLAAIIVILAAIVHLRTADLQKANALLHDDINARKRAEEMLRRTQDSLTRRVDELATLNRITQTIVTVSDLESMLQAIAREMVLLFHANNSAVALLNDSKTELIVVENDSETTNNSSAIGTILPLKNNFAILQTIEQKHGIIVPQAQTNPLTAGSHDVLRRRKTENVMIVPLLSRGEVFGVIGIDSTDKEREFTLAELRLAETIAGQMAGGIENARLFEEERRQRQVAESLRKVSTALMGSLDLDTVLQEIMKQLKKVISYDSGAIFLREGNELVLTSGMNVLKGHTGFRFSLADLNPTVRVFHAEHASTIANTEADPAWSAWEGSRVKSWMGAPLLTFEQKVFGVLTADSFKADTYTENDLQVLQLFANQAAIALENARQVKQTQRALDETRLLYKVSRILAKTEDIQQGVEQVLGEYLQALHLQQGGVSLFSDDKQYGQLYALYQDGTPQPPGLEINNISQAHQQIILSGKPLAISNVLEDPLLAENRELNLNLGIQSLLLVPLLVRGQVIGFLGADSTVGIRNFSEREIALAQSIADHVAAAVDRAQLLEEAYRAIEAAETANQSKNIFFASMSHELRTPLNAILGLTRMMVREEHLSAEEGENLRIIQQSGEHLLHLINNVLDLSRIEAGQMPLEERNIDLQQLLNELQTMFSLKAREKLLTLSCSRSAEVPQYIRTDDVKLRQVLINLLNNAMKFTDHGTISIEVETLGDDIAVQQHHLLFRVKDTGQGIAQEEIHQVFEAFVQSETGRQTREGSGLGLSISRKFVQLLGGEIQVESTIGQGATFSFDIFAHAVQAHALKSSEAMKRAVGLEPGQPLYKMLIVDDKADNRAVLFKLLQPFAFDLREAHNGREAVELWEKWQPHVIWMDLRMAFMSGYEATQKIRTSHEGRQPVIIAVTADVFDENRSSEGPHIFDAILHKPFHDTEVFHLLNKHLGIRFVYEKRDEQSAADSSKNGGTTEGQSTILTADMLRQLPEALSQQLRQASEALQIETVQELITQIRQYDSATAETLKMLVGQYRFDILQRLFKELDND